MKCLLFFNASLDQKGFDPSLFHEKIRIQEKNTFILKLRFDFFTVRDKNVRLLLSIFILMYF
jgi:hypothetical protein